MTIELEDESITTSNLADGSITTVKIKEASITSGKIQDATILGRDFADSSITSIKIKDGSVTTSKLVKSAVTTEKIEDGTISNVDISSTASIVYAKLNLTESLQFSDIGQNGCTDGQVMKWSDTESKWVCSNDVDTNTYLTELQVEEYITNSPIDLSEGSTVDSELIATEDWVEDKGYITDGNTNWDNNYGFITASSTDTLTNKTLENPQINFTDSMVSQNVLVHAYGTGYQYNLVSGEPTIVELDSISYDLGSDFDTDNYIFVAPVSGYYFLNGQIEFSEAVTERGYSLYVKINGIAKGWGYSSPSVGYVVVASTTIRYLNAGDEVSLWALQSSGVDTVDLRHGSYITFLEVMLVSL